MRDRLLGYFERELTYLRQMGAEFAAKYPKIASRLLLEPERCEDPHVERLIEGVAFLNAKVRQKLDDELPEVTESLLGVVYPHFLAPVPSMSVVQFEADPKQGQLTGSYEIPRHTMLSTGSVRGTRCRFRTAYPVTLWPLEVSLAEIHVPPVAQPMPGRRDFLARTMIRLQIRTTGEATLDKLDLHDLRLFLEGEPSVTAGLYELLVGARTQVELHAVGRREGTTAQLLPADALTPVGFGRDEMLLPYPLRSFRGYCLLQEYFCFPRKFLFIDLIGLDRVRRVGVTDGVEIRIFCDRLPTFEQTVDASQFRLGCSPVVNLFEKPAEPIWVDHTREEYLVVPDVHGPEAHEVYSIDSVASVEDGGGKIRHFEPFYGFRHRAEGDVSETFWQASRREALDGASDVYLTLLDTSFSRVTPASETVSVRITCTNRDLPAALPFSGGLGEDLDSETVAPFVRVRCLGRPTAARRIDPGRGAQWKLVSHLSLNYLSMVEQGREALQGILELYDFMGSAATRRQIDSILTVRSEAVVRRVNGAFVRGRKVTLDLDEQGFVGGGAFLFAAVLEAFLGLYVSVNSFSLLEARSTQREEPIKVWPARSGEQIIL